MTNVYVVTVKETIEKNVVVEASCSSEAEAIAWVHYDNENSMFEYIAPSYTEVDVDSKLAEDVLNFDMAAYPRLSLNEGEFAIKFCGGSYEIALNYEDFVQCILGLYNNERVGINGTHYDVKYNDVVNNIRNRYLVYSNDEYDLYFMNGDYYLCGDEEARVLRKVR